MLSTNTASVCIALILCAGAAYAVNPPAEDASELILHSTVSSVSGINSGVDDPVIADVKPGDTFTITGDCIGRVKSADNLRVVLTISDGETMPGYRSLIATDQMIGDGGLQVRVPDLPDAANRVFSVKVFRLGQDAPEACDAGAIRIGGAAAGKVG
jgi:hypothetical protein